MAEKSGLFNSAVGNTREYNDVDMATMFSLLTGGEGYIVGNGNELEVIEGVGLQVKVRTGAAWIGNPAGWWYINDEEKVLEISAESEGVNRIDRVILRLNRSSIALCVTTVIKQGGGEEENPPNLTQDEMTYELSLAQVHVTGGSTDITVVDERNSEFCGALNISGEGSTSTFKPSSVNTSVENYDVVAWDKDNDEWVTVQNGYAIYIDGKLHTTGSVIEVSGHSADDGYRAYVDSDGSISKDMSEFPCGVIGEGGAYLFIDFDGELGEVFAYTENMQKLIAMCGATGEVWLQIQSAPNEDGHKLYWKSTAWVSGDDASDGTLIEDITDDTGHYEGVNRYEVTGLTNEMTYYFKVVPYVGAKENWIIGENEITCDAGRVLNHFTFESSGDADVGSYNFTNVGATFVSAEIGNALKITNDYLTANDFTPDEFTFLTEIILKASDTHPLLAESQEVGGGITYGWGFYVDGSGNLIIENWNGGNISTGRNIVTFTTDMSTDHKYTLEIYYKKSTKTVNAYLDGVFQSKSGGLFTTSHTSPVATRIGCRVKDFYGGDGNFEMLSAWIISGAMSAIDRANSINGGASL